MPFTAQDLAHFNQFVARRIEGGEAQSIVGLAREWEAERREFNETVAELREAIADMEAGKGRLLSESMAETRAKYNIPESTG